MILADRFAPLKSRTITLHPELPWYDKDLLGDEKRKRRRLERRARRSKLQVDWDLFCQQRDHFNSLCEQAQTSYYRSTISEASSAKDKWRCFNNLLGKSNSSPLPAHTSQDVLANDFNNSFFTKKKFKPFELALQRTQWTFLITSAMFGLIS